MAQEPDVGIPGNEPQPTLSADTTWVVPLLLWLHSLIFIGAAIVGPIYLANVPQMVEVTLAHEPRAHGKKH